LSFDQPESIVTCADGLIETTTGAHHPAMHGANPDTALTRPTSSSNTLDVPYVYIRYE
jgi:hypothetical protein